MSIDEHPKNYRLTAHLTDDSEESGGTSSSSGGAGKIEFRDFLANAENLRDDLLPPEEMRRLIIVHREIHLSGVKKLKELQAYREAVKEGKVPLETYRQGLDPDPTRRNFKQNPRLKSPQFTVIDNKVNPLPNINVAETNQDKRQELVYRNELKNRPVPEFNPKPSFNR